MKTELAANLPLALNLIRNPELILDGFNQLEEMIHFYRELSTEDQQRITNQATHYRTFISGLSHKQPILLDEDGNAVKEADGTPKRGKSPFQCYIEKFSDTKESPIGSCPENTMSCPAMCRDIERFFLALYSNKAAKMIYPYLFDSSTDEQPTENEPTVGEQVVEAASEVIETDQPVEPQLETPPGD